MIRCRILRYGGAIRHHRPFRDPTSSFAEKAASISKYTLCFREDNKEREFGVPAMSIQRRSLGLYRHADKSFDPTPPEPFQSPPKLSELRTSDEMDFYDPLTEDTPPLTPEEEEELLLIRKRETEEEEERQRVRDELDTRTGRLWTDPWEITDEDWMAGKTFDDLPDWTPQMSSRVSLERVKVHPDGIPTLSTLATLPLPPPPAPHPGHGKVNEYYRHRKSQYYDLVRAGVADLAGPRVNKILTLRTWEEKQDAVDELFEVVEKELKEREDIWGKQPNFGYVVEKALEEYLEEVQEREEKKALERTSTSSSPQGDDNVDADANNEKGEEKTSSVDTDVTDKGDDTKVSPATAELPTEEDDMNATPVFVDLIGSKSSSGSSSKGEKDNKGVDGEADVDENGVPKIIRPLRAHHAQGTGRMIEEWELAANKQTKRIMMRQCTRKIAQLLDRANKDKTGARIYVTGKKGVGKTAALAAIVASARISGHIVMYLPDGDRFRKLGKYIEPSSHRRGLFDLPVLAKEVCTIFLESHENVLEGMVAERSCLEKFLTADQIRRLMPEGSAEDDTVGISLIELLKAGSKSNATSSGCYSAVVDTLMNQTSKSFVIVLDEFNCYYDHGHYFHMEYDKSVRKSIPSNIITLFKPFLDAMAISPAVEGSDGMTEPVLMKRGCIVVGTTESRAVARKFTDGLTVCAEAAAAAQNENNPLHVIEVPRFSKIEVEHILANFEVTGIGRLRFDRGDTVMDEQEVAFLKMVSGGVGQNLMDACII